MQTKCLLKFAAALLLLSTISQPLSTLFAQGTAFTYQGRLNSGGTPANGSYDIAFSLYATNTSGVAIAGPVTNSAVPVTNGLFTTLVDFGANAFTGTSNWLAIAVSTNGANTFISLSPRQQLTPMPYAIYAESANATNLTGTIAAVSLPNGLGGSGNTASGPNSTVSGGGGNQVDGTSSYSTIGAGNANSISGTVDATIGGGYQNTINNVGGYGTIGGGNNNFIASTLDGTIAGGYHNMITNGATFAAVGGGNGNAVGGGLDSVIGGGYQNFVNASFATVPGGANNSALANYTFAAGDQAQAVNAGAFVWADSQGVNFSSTNNNSFNVRAQGGARFVTSGAGLNVDGPVTATSLTGNGSGLTALNGSQITSGTVADARLSSNVALRAGGNTFTGNQVINAEGAGVKVAGTAAPSTYFGSLISDGSSGDFWFLSAYNASGSKRNTIYGAGGSTPLVFQEQGGNVGIGITTPTNTLQVNGTVAASALRAPGAGVNTGTFAFIQRAVGTNTAGDATIIFNPVCDGDPNAILIVTHNWTADTNSTSQYNTKPVGVYYTGANWAIFNEDTSSMALGRAFNVMVIKN